MADLPMLYQPEMIRALWKGHKTQTRRLIKPQPPAGFTKLLGFIGTGCTKPVFANDYNGRVEAKLRIQGGDRIWVKENYLPDPPSDDPSWSDNVCSYVEWSGCGSKVSDIPLALRNHNHAIYAADQKWAGVKMRWRPSIHMPRWASRMTLIVTNVRVERLQDISQDDAIAEGIEKVPYQGEDPQYAGSFGWKDYSDHPHSLAPFHHTNAALSYQTLWDSINGGPSPVVIGGRLSHYVSYPWDGPARIESYRGAPHHVFGNPWIVAYSFRVIKRNIDAIPATPAAT